MRIEVNLADSAPIGELSDWMLKCDCGWEREGEGRENPFFFVRQHYNYDHLTTRRPL